jgi:hypothetical protein
MSESKLKYAWSEDDLTEEPVIDDRGDETCEWPGCTATGDPCKDHGWCFFLRYYLQLPEGFYCPEHTAFIEEGQRTGYFKDWPRDMSPEVLAILEAYSQFVPLESEEGQRIIDEIERE